MSAPALPAAREIADAVRARRTTARDVVAAALLRIKAGDPALNCFTAITGERALADAARVDRLIGEGRDPGPLAGVPFAAKNLFDVAGVVTLAGSRINLDRPAPARDAAAVAALTRAGAVLVGTTNMEEYAYGFTTENAHFGATRNPHDPARVAGGSSGGSAAAVAAGLAPLALGTDTNGSIRVPAALCGVFGLKPTYGRVSRAGVFPLAASLDHVGPFARSVHDLALAYDALQGPDPADPACSARPAARVLPELSRGTAGLRIAVAGGHFARGAAPEALAAVERVAQALGAGRRVTVPEAHRARAADFDPITRDRFLAAALLPAALYVQAQRFRAWFRARVHALFQDVDVLLAPTTPYPAPPIGAPRTTTVGGSEVMTRPHLGVFTQPLSFIGLPVLSVPVVQPGALPLGVQLVAAPFAEAALLRVASALEAEGVVAAPLAPPRSGSAGAT